MTPKMRLKNCVRHITVIVIFCELSAMHFFLIVTKSHCFKMNFYFILNVSFEQTRSKILDQNIIHTKLLVFEKLVKKSVALLSPPGRLKQKHRFLNHLIFSLLFSPFALVWRVGKNRRFQIKSDKSLLTIPLQIVEGNFAPFCPRCAFLNIGVKWITQIGKHRFLTFFVIFRSRGSVKLTYTC